LNEGIQIDVRCECGSSKFLFRQGENEKISFSRGESELWEKVKVFWKKDAGQTRKRVMLVKVGIGKEY